MPYQLTFSIRQVYDDHADGVTVETRLSYGSEWINCQAKLDPGAQVCLFSREIGDELGLEIEAGHYKLLGTLTGTLSAYGHFVRLQTLGLEFDSMLYFAQDYGLPRNLLGREGWLQKVRLAIVDYDATLYLSTYDETNGG